MHACVRRRPIVFAGALCGVQRAVKDIACIVHIDKAVALGPREHPANLPAHLSRGLVLGVPQGLHDCQHLLLVDAVNRNVAQSRERVFLERVQPGTNALRGTHALFDGLQYTVQRLAERGHGTGRRHGEWVLSLPSTPTVLRRYRTSVRQTEQSGVRTIITKIAKDDIAALAVHRQTLQPVSAAVRRDDKQQGFPSLYRPGVLWLRRLDALRLLISTPRFIPRFERENIQKHERSKVRIEEVFTVLSMGCESYSESR